MSTLEMDVKEEQAIIEGEQKQEEAILSNALLKPIKKLQGKYAYKGHSENGVTTLPSGTRYVETDKGWRKVRE